MQGPISDQVLIPGFTPAADPPGVWGGAPPPLWAELSQYPKAKTTEPSNRPTDCYYRYPGLEKVFWRCNGSIQVAPGRAGDSPHACPPPKNARVLRPVVLVIR